MVLKKSDVKTLFDYARKSIEEGFNGKEYKPKKVPNELKISRGVFVTLNINNELRGCVGFIKPLPLWEGIIKAAYSSAFQDSRFNPLTKEEYNQVLIEISILTKPEKTTRESIKKGDGIIITKGWRSALFLPQVWNELADKELFLNHLYLKAGLMPGEEVTYECFSVKAWKENSRFSIKPVHP